MEIDLSRVDPDPANDRQAGDPSRRIHELPESVQKSLILVAFHELAMSLGRKVEAREQLGLTDEAKSLMRFSEDDLKEAAVALCQALVFVPADGEDAMPDDERNWAAYAGPAITEQAHV